MYHTKKIVTSKNSSIALLENGEIFSWGSCLNGILGLGEGLSDNQYFPVKVILSDPSD